LLWSVNIAAHCTLST
jgi:hypothetical protein